MLRMIRRSSSSHHCHFTTGARPARHPHRGYHGLLPDHAALRGLMTKSFIDEVPREVEQAAEILGASRWRTVFEIVLPLIRSGWWQLSSLSSS